MTDEERNERISVNIDAWWGVFEGRAMVALFPWKQECFEWIRCRGSEYSQFKILQLQHIRPKTETV